MTLSYMVNWLRCDGGDERKVVHEQNREPRNADMMCRARGRVHLPSEGARHHSPTRCDGW